MEGFLAEVMPSIFEVLAIVVVALIGWVGSALKKWLNEKGALEKLDKYGWLAEIAVRAAEDIFKNEEGKGQEKLEHAKVMFLEMIPKSAKVTQIELDSFIRDAYKRTVETWEEPLDEELPLELGEREGE